MREKEKTKFKPKGMRGLIRGKGFTQKEIASLLGISVPSLVHRLNGDSEFKASELLILSQEFGVSVDDLLSLLEEDKK